MFSALVLIGGGAPVAGNTGLPTPEMDGRDTFRAGTHFVCFTTFEPGGVS
jgi:hypothetical protein